jgi:hypothetical protein
MALFSYLPVAVGPPAFLFRRLCRRSRSIFGSSRRHFYFGGWMSTNKLEPDETAAEELEQPKEEAKAPQGLKEQSPCRKCQNWDEVKERVRIREALDNAISKLEAKFQESTFKPSVGDYIKLVQLEREFEQEEVKEISVKWVGPVPEPKKSE